MGIAARTDFSRTKRPPRERRHARQPPKRISTFSNTGCQSWIRRRRSTSGTPRYRIGRVPIGVSRIWEHPFSSAADKPKPTRVDLARFSLSPEKSENISIMIESVCAVSVDPWMKNVVSSAYCSKGMPPGRLVDWNPVKASCRHTCDVHTAKSVRS